MGTVTKADRDHAAAYTRFRSRVSHEIMRLAFFPPAVVDNAAVALVPRRGTPFVEKPRNYSPANLSGSCVLQVWSLPLSHSHLPPPFTSFHVPFFSRRELCSAPNSPLVLATLSRRSSSRSSQSDILIGRGQLTLNR